MIQVYADDELIYTPELDDYKLEGLTVTVNRDKAGTAEIVMPAGHPAYNAFTSYRTVVTVYRAGELLFRGRALYPTDDFYNSRTVTCEGERCFLRDAVMLPYLYQSTPAAIFSDVIRRYNAQVEPFKRFKVGRVTAYDPNNYIRLENETAEQVSDTIDKLVERVGGYIVFTTNSAGLRVINWYGSLDHVSTQAIEFGENLLDFSRTGANTELATVIWPYGAKDEETGKYVTIASVNGGREYIQDDEAVALRGSIAIPLYWDDVTEPANLMAKARQELNVRKLIVTSLELSAVDLSGMGKDIDSFRVGDNVPVYSPPHGLDEVLPLSSRTYNLLDASQDKVVLGADVLTLTGSEVASNRSALQRLRRTEQSIKTDYKIRISDAVNNLRI